MSIVLSTSFFRSMSVARGRFGLADESFRVEICAKKNVSQTIQDYFK
jgi:hypothetical protein